MINQKFFEQWLDSWTAHSSEKVLTFYHPDIFYTDPATPNGLQGIETLKKYLDKLLAKYGDWKWTLVHFDSVGTNRFYVKWKMTSPRNANETFGIDLVEMRDDLIIRNEVYFNPTNL